MPRSASAFRSRTSRPCRTGTLRSTWKQARPGRIRASFDVAQSQDPGGWYVVGRSEDVGTKRSVTRTIAGREIVLWRDEWGP